LVEHNSYDRYLPHKLLFQSIIAETRREKQGLRLGGRVAAVYNTGMHNDIQYYRFVLVLASILTVVGAVSDAVAQSRSPFDDARNKMVDDEIVAAGVTNPRVIEVMRETPRHEFIPVNLRNQAYFDMALPIGESQTISPPFVVAFMTEALDPQPNDIVLEIGTGSGYQAAVLSKLVREVYTIEIVAPLGHKAAKTLERLHYNNVYVKVGDGYQGWPEHAPFDKIIVTCSPEKVPPALVEQLREGGRMVIPVGERYQQTLCLMKKVDGKMESESLQPTLFVPMTGAAEASREVQPDPAHPTIANGSFEELEGDPPRPVGWHYQRQLRVIENPLASNGKRYVTFNNAEAGRNSHALQGFAVDGRKVSKLQLSAFVRCKDVKPGAAPDQIADIAIMFYDEKRALVGETSLGPWKGSFDWKTETKRVDVPPKAREGIIRIGLFGATGEMSVDAIEVKSAKK
jgi:protein-L-isoaspartate(D-aspartate) O-methyltransferase